MPAASIVSTLTFTPPLGGSPISIQFPSSETYIPQSVGTIDIPIAAAANTVFAIPFGGVGSADVLFIRNRGNQDLGVRLNGIPASPAVLYQIPPNGFLLLFNPVVPGGSPLTSAVVETVAIQASAVGQVDYYVFGAT